MTTLRKEAGRPRIVDLVFARDAGAPAARRRAAVAIVAAAAVHAGALAWGLSTRAPLEAWTAAAASRIAAEIGRDRAIDLPAPPPPPPPPPAEPAREAPAPPPPPPAAAAPPRAQAAPPPAPAEAGRIVAAPDDAPADLTAAPFVVGTGDRYAGGATTSSGTSRDPAPASAVSGGTGPATAPPSPAPRGPDRSRPVSLPDDAWSCPWPAEAETADLDEAVAVIRVRVRPDGTARDVVVLQDPGRGFGAAAIACARGTRFSPARDRGGVPIEADSPAIRVRFTR